MKFIKSKLGFHKYLSMEKKVELMDAGDYSTVIQDLERANEAQERALEFVDKATDLLNLSEDDIKALEVLAFGYYNTNIKAKDVEELVKLNDSQDVVIAKKCIYQESLAMFYSDMNDYQLNRVNDKDKTYFEEVLANKKEKEKAIKKATKKNKKQ